MGVGLVVVGCLLFGSWMFGVFSRVSSRIFFRIFSRIFVPAFFPNGTGEENYHYKGKLIARSAIKLLSKLLSNLVFRQKLNLFVSKLVFLF